LGPEFFSVGVKPTELKEKVTRLPPLDLFFNTMGVPQLLFKCVFAWQD